MAKSFLIDRLPVPMTALEERLTSVGSPDSKINIFTRLRMLRPGLARAMVEDGMVVVYHCMDNSRALHGNALSPLEFELDDGPAIEKLLDSYPRGVLISQLPHPSEEDEDKVAVAATLYKEGFLVRMDDEMEEMKDSLSRAGGEEGHTNYDANESDDSSPF